MLTITTILCGGPYKHLVADAVRSADDLTDLFLLVDTCANAESVIREALQVPGIEARSRIVRYPYWGERFDCATARSWCLDMARDIGCDYVARIDPDERFVSQDSTAAEVRRYLEAERPDIVLMHNDVEEYASAHIVNPHIATRYEGAGRVHEKLPDEGKVVFYPGLKWAEVLKTGAAAAELQRMILVETARWIAEEPENGGAWKLRGDVLFDHSDFVGAFRAYKASYDFDTRPDYAAWAAYRAAECQLRIGQTTMARQWCDRSIQACDAFPESHYLLAKLELGRHNYRGAIQSAQRAQLFQLVPERLLIRTGFQLPFARREGPSLVMAEALSKTSPVEAREWKRGAECLREEREYRCQLRYEPTTGKPIRYRERRAVQICCCMPCGGSKEGVAPKAALSVAKHVDHFLLLNTGKSAAKAIEVLIAMPEVADRCAVLQYPLADAPFFDCGQAMNWLFDKAHELGFDVALPMHTDEELLVPDDVDMHKLAWSIKADIAITKDETGEYPKLRLLNLPRVGGFYGRAHERWKGTVTVANIDGITFREAPKTKEEEDARQTKLIEVCAQWVKDEPEYGRARLHLGNALLHFERYADALPYFVQCFQLSQDREERYWSMIKAASCHIELSDIGSALELCCLAMREQPNRAEAPWMAGYASGLGGQHFDAIHWCRLAITNSAQNRDRRIEQIRTSWETPVAYWEGPWRTLQEAYTVLGLLDDARYAAAKADELEAARLGRPLPGATPVKPKAKRKKAKGKR